MFFHFITIYVKLKKMADAIKRIEPYIIRTYQQGCFLRDVAECLQVTAYIIQFHPVKSDLIRKETH